MTKTEKLVQHGAEIQRDLDELRRHYATLAGEAKRNEQNASQLKTRLAQEEAEVTYYKTLAKKLSEKLDMMETAVCNLVSMIVRK